MRASGAAPRRAAKELEQADRLTRAGRLSDALAVLEQARETDPFDARVLLELARLAGRLSLPEAAEKCAGAALDLEPDNCEILIERTIALRALSRHDDAVSLLRARLTRQPERAELWLALANTVHEMGLLDEAETFLREALRLEPDKVEARANLAGLMSDRGDIAGAIEEYRAAIRRAPNNAQMRFNHALLSLHHGDLKSGWREYEQRLKISSRKIERLFHGKPPKRWDGSARNGKSLLVMTEQGLGEQILFASLLPDLLAHDHGPVLMDCEPRLVPLMERSFPGVRVHASTPKHVEGRTRVSYEWLGSSAPDLAIELGSLPRLLRPTIESFPSWHAPFKADAEEAARWRGWLDSLGGGPKIGLCWRSGKRGGLRDIQYAPLEHWALLAAEPKGQLIVVQYDVTDDELDALSEASDRPLHVPPGLAQRDEIDRLGALLAELDAVVSAPTMVAVLAAAVGTPTIKLTHSGSWTALGLQREAFLPAARIIRPQQPGDWSQAFRLAQHALDEVLGAP